MTLLDATSCLLALTAALFTLSCGGPSPNPSGDGDPSDETGGSTGNPGTGGSAEPGACTGCNNGCCDGDTCVPYSAQSAGQCGSDGLTCQTCTFGERCSDGSCETDFEVCSPLSCEGGCCNEGECVRDTYWGACGGDGESCNTCQYGVECGEDGTCTSLIHDDAIFTIKIHSVQLDQTNLGASWDVGSAPEPFVCVTDGTSEACTEAECDNSLTCTFPLSGALNLNITGIELKTGSIEVVVWDHDGVLHDQAGAAAVQLLDLQESYTFEPFGAVLSLELSLQ